MTTASLLNGIKSFPRWYWSRVKEIPIVFGAFALGCITEAVMIIFPQIALMVLGR